MYSNYDVFYYAPDADMDDNKSKMEARIAADQLDKAREACAYVSREISADLSISLQLRRSKKHHHHNRFNEAISVVSNVLRKVKRYEKQVTEELAMLAAADAEMKLSIVQARDATKCIPAPTLTKKKEIAMNSACDGYSNSNNTCQYVDLKGVLSLLIALS